LKYIKRAYGEETLPLASVITLEPNQKDLLTPHQHFSYPLGFSGDPDLASTLTTFFNDYFAPHEPVQDSHIATAPGAASCLDALLHTLCDPGDGVLVPGPYWSMRIE
jgi:aspartate/methionine/tyrosine aminotransferase